MKFVATLIITLLLAYAAGFYFPWWSIAVVAFVVSLLLPQRPFPSFLAGFLGVFLLWAGLASYIDIKNQHLLAGRISQLLFQTQSHYLLILVTGLIGGLTAGLAALSASFIRKGKAEQN
jgi:hypothetical protein